MTNANKFFKAMKRWRKVAGLSQEKAAEKIGVSRITVQYWEGGQRPTMPKKEYIEKIIKTYNLDRDVFMKEYALALAPVPTTDINTGADNQTTALAKMIATTFYSLSPEGFNPVRVNVYIPPAKTPMRNWVSYVNSAFCESHGLGEMERRIMDKVTEIVMCVVGAIKMDENRIFREADKEKMKEVTLDKVYRIIEWSIYPVASKAKWFSDGFRNLQARTENHSTFRKANGNKNLSLAQKYIEEQFHENSQEGNDALARLLLALRPFYCGVEKEMFCGGESIDDFVNGNAMVVLDGAREEKFFRKLIANGRPAQFPIPKMFKDEKDEIVKQAKAEILAMATDIEKREEELKETERKDAEKIADMEARIRYLTQYLAEAMSRAHLSPAFKSLPRLPYEYQREIEKLSTADLGDGFRESMTLTQRAPQEKHKEQTDTILSSAYERYGMEHKKEFDGSFESVNKINQETKKIIGNKMVQILKTDDEKTLIKWATALKQTITYIAEGNCRKSAIEVAIREKFDAKIAGEILPLCEEIGLVEKYISSGKGRPSMNYRLSYLGAIYFATLGDPYKQAIVLREARTGNAVQSIEHKRLVDQTQELFEKNGYMTDGEDSALFAADGGYRFDILAKKKGGGRVYLDCDLAKGSHEHYREKIDGIFAATPYALFITPNQETARALSTVLMDVKGSKVELKKKGLFWEVVSFEEAKKRFKDDELWPVRKKEAVEKLKEEKDGRGKTTEVVEGFSDWG